MEASGELLHRRVSREVIELGHGFLESVYEAALAIRLHEKATSLRVGLLLNFGPRPEFRRRVFS
jgi:hypothetical protein